MPRGHAPTRGRIEDPGGAQVLASAHRLHDEGHPSTRAERGPRLVVSGLSPQHELVSAGVQVPPADCAIAGGVQRRVVGKGDIPNSALTLRIWARDFRQIEQSPLTCLQVPHPNCPRAFALGPNITAVATWSPLGDTAASASAVSRLSGRPSNLLGGEPSSGTTKAMTEWATTKTKRP